MPRPARAAALFAAIPPETAGMPLYRLVKRALLRAIEDGRCRPGAALPSETEIAGEMGVSIGTLRRAVDELAAEHIVVRRQGRGTFVATHNTDRFLFQFFHVERADGLREAPRVDLVSFERTRADEEAAEALELRAGEPVIQMENRLRLQGAAVIYDRLVLPAALFKGLSEKRMRERPGTIYQFYQSDFGISVLRARERARAVAADRHAVRVLGVPPGQPVMQVRRTALSFHDRPVEYRVSTINTAHHDYVNLLSRPVGKHD
ncbi:GntR family transcriptional regulator [Piscinibacter sakaiensis]|uniref:Putative alkanesulfonate metabolism utilization regulator n=1 Tax=Piscinibacter sakaiensis TaxID=1547922 RepID=A0A0K8P5J3_PISS1|nr:GntR family transcriptional regulator [Piscinibacter sakaiensis]GAP37475.1 putative alkanesulfonate metabolism utilization regulator [Piscinibacter sakaiensis]